MLPIDAKLPELLTQLQKSSQVLLIAEPGAGKTTKVPLALLDQHWLAGKKILLLEPRRFAAISAAQYMAESLGETVGETVGLRMRSDTRVSARTRVEVITEGVLSRLLHADPDLPDVGCIIFDEFHERNVQGDLGLAFALESQLQLRADLRILIMSATIKREPLMQMLEDLVVVECPGRTYPIEYRYLERESDLKLEALVTNGIRRACKECEGDILVFLPGRAEIARCAALLEERAPGEQCEIIQLTADSSGSKTNLFASPRLGTRRIILATNVAESSVTIAGVRVVVDSGLTRVAIFDSGRGVSGLRTIKVSLASATQRAGRAGREAPGICYRMWTKDEERSFEHTSRAEISLADPLPIALEFAAWGDPKGVHLHLLDRPSAALFSYAAELLKGIGALSNEGIITPHGKELLQFGTHPRHAHMLLRAKKLNCGALACELVALLEEPPLSSKGGMQDHLSVSEQWEKTFHSKTAQHRSGKIVQRAADLRARLRVKDESHTGDDIALLIAFAFPDFIAMQRSPGDRRYLLSCGFAAELPERHPLTKHKFLAVAQLDGANTNAKIYRAEPLDEDELQELGEEVTEIVSEVTWDERTNSAKLLTRKKLGALILHEKLETELSATQELALQTVLCEKIRSAGLKVLAWSSEATQICDRVRWLQKIGRSPESWPEFSEERLLATLEEWLLPGFPAGAKSFASLQSVDLLTMLKNYLGWGTLNQIDTLAPEFFTAKNGRRSPYLYGGDGVVTLPIYLQDLFGEKETPKVGGNIAVTLELLSPARRPLQVTRDLSSFWKTVYPSLKTQMRARYSKHFWPEDPLTALPPEPRRRRG